MAKVKQRYIKSENRKWLIGYLLLHIIIFALFSGLVSPTFSDVNQLLSKLKDPQGFLPLIAVIFSIVLEGIFSNPIKEFLVFWRIKNRLPGHRAFSCIGPKDSRIDMEKIKSLYPEGLPVEAKKQNSEWFNLYKKYQDELQIFHSHKVFLLTRDLAALTVAVIPFSVIAHIIAGTKGMTILNHIFLLLGLLVIISLPARNYGNRFVANVLVEATGGEKF